MNLLAIFADIELTSHRVFGWITGTRLIVQFASGIILPHLVGERLL